MEQTRRKFKLFNPIVDISFQSFFIYLRPILTLSFHVLVGYYPQVFQLAFCIHVFCVRSVLFHPCMLVPSETVMQVEIFIKI